MGRRAVGFAVAVVFLVIGGCLLGYFLWPRKDEPGIAFATLLATLRPVSAEAMLEAARSADAAAVAAAKKAADAKAAALAAQLNTELRAALAAEAAKLTAAAEAAAALAAKLNGELRAAEAAEAAKRVAEAQAAQAAEAAEAAKRVAEAAEAAEAAKRVVEAQAAEAAKAERRKGTVPIEAALPVPVVSETTLPSWPFDVGVPGASCAATCDGKGLVCDEERQASATYGRAIAFEALRRGGVAQKEASEDEWQGRFRVRDKYTFEQVGAMPGVLMAGSAGSAGSEGVPNWKGEDNKSAPSTCAASLEGLRRVCACKAPATNPPATNPPATPVPERAALALSAGERATGLETRFVYERGKGFFPNVPETPGPNPEITTYLIPETLKQYGDFGTYVLVIELVEGALERLGEGTIQLFKIAEGVNGSGDPLIDLSRARGFRVLEGGGSKELDPPAYYAGTKLAFINDRKRRDSEMVVRAGDKTITVKMSVSFSGSTNGLMGVQFHALVKRAVFLWGLDTVTLDVSALKAEV